MVGLKYVKVVKGGDSTLLRFSCAHSRKLHSALGNMLAGPIEVAREISESRAVCILMTTSHCSFSLVSTEARATVPS